MRSFSPQEDELLIELVYNNPPLYDNRLPTYKDNAAREKIWNDIRKILKRPSDDCKKRWKYIRDSFNRCKRRSFKTTKWIMIEKLRFLEKFPIEKSSSAKSQEIESNEERNETPINSEDVKDELNGDVIITSDVDIKPDIIFSEIFPIDINPSTSSIQTYTSEATNTEHVSMEIVQNNEIIPNNTPTTNHTDIRSEKKNRKRKRTNEFNTSLIKFWQDKEKTMQEQMKLLQSKQALVDREEVKSFCAHIESVLFKLSPALRVVAKTKLFNILTEYEMKSLEENDTSNTSQPITMVSLNTSSSSSSEVEEP